MASSKECFMKVFIGIITFGSACVMMAGCHSTETDLAPAVPVSTVSPAADAALVELYRQDQEEQAIIRQHTLYPYHFVDGSDTLNEAGHRELTVLARHFAASPGSISLQRGNASPALYDRRAATVLAAMTNAGVDQVTIVDELPAGDGLSSTHILLILERHREGDGKESAGSSQATMGDEISNAGTGEINR